nr:hypothetical protein [uncultured Allomuricauda sp.]
MSNKKSSAQLTDKENFEFVEIGYYSGTEKLFLDFYKGMSHEEFRTALKDNIQKEKLFFINKDSTNDNETDRSKIYKEINVSFLTKLDISNAGFMYDNVYYKFNFGNEYYMANLEPTFSKSSTLLKIELTLPVYVTSLESAFYKNDFDINKAVHIMYRSKYGTPQIINKGSSIFWENSDYPQDIKKDFQKKYIYQDGDRKTIAIVERLCCANLTSITYMLFEDFNKEQDSLRQQQENIQKEKQNLRNSTKSDI